MTGDLRDTAARALFDAEYSDIPAADRDEAWTAWHHLVDAFLAAVADDDTGEQGHAACICGLSPATLADAIAHHADAIRAWLRGRP